IIVGDVADREAMVLAGQGNRGSFNPRPDRLYNFRRRCLRNVFQAVPARVPMIQERLERLKTFTQVHEIIDMGFERSVGRGRWRIRSAFGTRPCEVQVEFKAHKTNRDFWESWTIFLAKSQTQNAPTSVRRRTIAKILKARSSQLLSS